MTVTAGGRVEVIGSGLLISPKLTVAAASGMSLGTEAEEITAQVTGTGDMVICETDSVVLKDVTTADGSITVSAGGTVTAVHVASQADSDENDISLSTSGDIEVGNILAGAQGDAILAAGGEIVDLGTMIMADELTVTATGPITLVTTVHALTATSNGTITVTETDDIFLNSILIANGAVSITAGGGIAVNHMESSADVDGNDITLASTSGDIVIDFIRAGRSAARSISLQAVTSVKWTISTRMWMWRLTI